jgi:hypothetical protein
MNRAEERYERPEEPAGAPLWISFVSVLAGGAAAVVGLRWSYAAAFGGTRPFIGTEIPESEASVGVGLLLLMVVTPGLAMVAMLVALRLSLLVAKVLRLPH